jgi:hypothetical protein
VAGVAVTGVNCGVLVARVASSGAGVAVADVVVMGVVRVASSGAGVAVIGVRLLLVVSGGSTKMVMVSLATNSSATGLSVELSVDSMQMICKHTDRQSQELGVAVRDEPARHRRACLKRGNWVWSNERGECTLVNLKPTTRLMQVESETK